MKKRTKKYDIKYFYMQNVAKSLIYRIRSLIFQTFWGTNKQNVVYKILFTAKTDREVAYMLYVYQVRLAK